MKRQETLGGIEHLTVASTHLTDGVTAPAEIDRVRTAYRLRGGFPEELVGCYV
jgi:hypothetical protein